MDRLEIAKGFVGVELRPRRTGFLWWLSVRNWPGELARTMRSLKELVPISMDAKREEGGGDFGRVVAMSLL